MATGKSGYLPTYNAGRMYVTPHYVEEYDAVGNYSRVKIDYIDFTSSHYEQGVNWDVAVSFNINGVGYSFSGDVTTHSYTAQRCVCSIVSDPIYHNNDGSKSITVTMTYAWWANGTVGYRWEDSGTLSTASVALTTIPRASELSVSNGTLGVAQTLTVDKKADSYIHAIKYTCGSVEEYIVWQVGDTRISWTPPLSLAGQNTTGAQVNVTLTIHTYTADGTWIASEEYPITCTIPDSVGLTVSDGWAKVQPYNDGTPASTLNAFVQGYSKAQVTFDASKISAANAYGAEIAGYHIVYNRAAYTAPYRTPVLTASGSDSVNCVVYDTRGRSVSQTVYFTVEAYRKPTLSDISVFRCNSYGEESDEGTYVSVTAKGNISSVNGLNSQTIKCEVGSLISTTIQSGQTVILGGGAVQVTSTYTVKLTLTDKLGNTAPYTQLIPTADVMFHARAGGSGAAFGKYSEEDDLLDVGWSIRGRKNLDIDGALTVAGNTVRAKRTRVGQSTTVNASKPWYKFASVTLPGAYEDLRISFKVTYGYANAVKHGVLNVSVRVNSNGNALESNVFHFESHDGLYTDRFVLAHSGLNVELWVNIPDSWTYCMVEVLSESSRSTFVDKWTLHDITSEGYAASPTSGYTLVYATSNDQVVAQGKSGIWTWRKWSSGIAECWGTTPMKTINTVAWGQVVEGDGSIASATAYPFSFITTPTVTAAPIAGDYSFWITSEWGGNASHSPTFDAVRPTAVTVTGAISMHAIGRWK